MSGRRRRAALGRSLRARRRRAALGRSLRARRRRGALGRSLRARRAAAALLAAAALAGGAAGDASAHSALTRAEPAAGATLGASPREVKLSFSERPQASLAEIRVLNRSGASVARAGPQPRDSAALAVPVGTLPRGVYTVTWRVVSAVDGHASSGGHAFGVGVSPAGVSVKAPGAKPKTSALEVAGRWVLLAGLALLLGGAVAGAARFGGSDGSDLRLAAGGWFVAAAGLNVLGRAQRDAADSSLADLLHTPVGEALIWRAVALAAAGAALLVAWRRPPVRRAALAAAAAAVTAAIVVHVDAGHAAAGSWPEALTVLSQTAHFVAAGVWFGGLAALLLGVRGAPSEQKAAAVRRFSSIALASVVVVAITGTLRAVDELPAWGELFSSGYGRAIVAKVALLGLIVALASRNRRISVPSAATDLRPLRRTSRPELVLAVGALAAAALLGSLAPPVAGQAERGPAISESGADFGTSVRVRLTAASAEPGPNTFTARVEDYDSRDPVDADRVRLRFAPLDDPGVEPSSLALRRTKRGSYEGTGANLAFDGRWRVTALIERGGGAVEVPVEVDVRGPDHFVSALRVPGKPPEYSMEIRGVGYIQIVPAPERAGPSRLAVNVFTVFESEAKARQLVVTTQAGGGPVRQRAVRRLSGGRFAAEIELAKGRNKVGVVARTDDGQRLRGVFDLDVPGG